MLNGLRRGDSKAQSCGDHAMCLSVITLTKIDLVLRDKYVLEEAVNSFLN